MDPTENSPEVAGCSTDNRTQAWERPTLNGATPSASIPATTATTPSIPADPRHGESADERSQADEPPATSEHQGRSIDTQARQRGNGRPPARLLCRGPPPGPLARA